MDGRFGSGSESAGLSAGLSAWLSESAPAPAPAAMRAFMSAHKTSRSLRRVVQRGEEIREEEKKEWPDCAPRKGARASDSLFEGDCCLFYDWVQAASVLRRLAAQWRMGTAARGRGREESQLQIRWRPAGCALQGVSKRLPSKRGCPARPGACNGRCRSQQRLASGSRPRRTRALSHFTCAPTCGTDDFPNRVVRRWPWQGRGPPRMEKRASGAKSPCVHRRASTEAKHARPL